MQISKYSDAKRTVVDNRLWAMKNSLVLEKNMCIVCDVCSKACPMEAVVLSSAGVDIDEKKCNLCEVCAYVCPTGAINIFSDKNKKEILRQSGGFPSFPKKLEIKVEKCPKDCVECEKACDMTTGGAIKVVSHKVIDVSEKCLRCVKCAEACPEGAIKVNPVFFGDIEINAEKCPTGCVECVDVCPTRAIKEKNGKVLLEKKYCVFCGACEVVCPAKDKGALVMKRNIMVSNGDGFSAIWTNALEKLTSTKSLAAAYNSINSEKLRKLALESQMVEEK